MRTKRKVCAYIWFNHVTPDVLDLHACSIPEVRGRWLNKGTLRRALLIFKYSGCRALIHQTITKEAARVSEVVGFEPVPGLPIGILPREKVIRHGKSN